MVKGARSKAGGIRAEGQCHNSLAVIAKRFGRIGRGGSIVDTDGVVGR